MMFYKSKKCMLQVVCVTLFVSSSTESPVDSKQNSTTTEDANSRGGTHASFAETDNNSVPKNGSIERWNHSKMLLKSTTLGYDEWWFLTTQRTPVSYKDFPGRPGVASWKEIGPGESRDSKKLRTSPTAEAASKTWRISSEYLWLYIIFYITFERFFFNP